MPKRPKQHRLEDKSRTKFQEVLPEMWVYRDKDKDYGIDAEVELFGHDEKAQGLVFWIQLKATESKNKSRILNVDIDIETLRYYKSLDIPVLLVRYSEIEDFFYIKWLDNVDLFFAKKGAKTYRIKLGESNKWNEKTFTEIEYYLAKIRQLKSGKFGFPLSIEISIVVDKLCGFSKSILSTQLKKELKKYPEFISIQSKLNNSIIYVTLDNDELKIDVSNLSGCSFHSIELRDKDNFSEIMAKDILLGIAVSMIRLGQVEYCGRIIFENKLEARLLENKELIEHLIIPLFHSSFFKEAISIFEELLNDEMNIGLSIVSHFHMLLASNANNPEKNIEIENFFKREIIRARTLDNQQVGIANYNLGNHYSNRDKFLEAIHHYNLAQKNAPNYLNQAYFFSEIASVLFRYGRYKDASIYYSKSLTIKYDNYTVALYADSIMFAGNYEQSILKFREYLEKTKKPADEFILKSTLLETVLEKYKIKNQFRNQYEANKSLDIINSLDASKILLKQYEKVLALDLLSELAWFNMGIIHYDEKNYDDSLECFIMSALINKGDIESWKNALISCFNSKTYLYLIQFIIATAFFYNGEEFLEELYSEFENQGKNEYLNMFSEYVNEILFNKEENEKKLPTIRILNEFGKFETIEEIISGHNIV